MTDRQQPDRPSGGQPGNQNSRRHGWTSRHHPASDEQLAQALAEAARQGDDVTVDHVARALTWRGQREAARLARRLARRIRKAAKEPTP